MFSTGLVVTDDTANLLSVLVLGPGPLLGVRALLANVAARHGGRVVVEGGAGSVQRTVGAARRETAYHRGHGQGHGGQDGGGGGQQVGIPPDRGGRSRHQRHLWHLLVGGGGGEG